MMGSAVRIRASASGFPAPPVVPEGRQAETGRPLPSLRVPGVGAVLLAALALVVAAPARGSHGAAFGIQDDAWLMYGPGTLADRLTTLENLGVGVVRFTLRWDQVAQQKPADPRSPSGYDWGRRHSALGHQPPISRTNLLGSNT